MLRFLTYSPPTNHLTQYGLTDNQQSDTTCYNLEKTKRLFSKTNLETVDVQYNICTFEMSYLNYSPLFWKR